MFDLGQSHSPSGALLIQCCSGTPEKPFSANCYGPFRLWLTARHWLGISPFPKQRPALRPRPELKVIGTLLDEKIVVCVISNVDSEATI